MEAARDIDFDGDTADALPALPDVVRIRVPTRLPEQSVANGESSEAMVESLGGQGQSMVPDGVVVQAIPDELPGLAREIRETVASLLHPDAVKGPAMESARHVCVTLVLSDELGATLEAAVVKGTGMRPH